MPIKKIRTVSYFRDFTLYLNFNSKGLIYKLIVLSWLRLIQASKIVVHDSGLEIDIILSSKRIPKRILSLKGFTQRHPIGFISSFFVSWNKGTISEMYIHLSFTRNFTLSPITRPFCFRKGGRDRDFFFPDICWSWLMGFVVWQKREFYSTSPEKCFLLWLLFRNGIISIPKIQFFAESPQDAVMSLEHHTRLAKNLKGSNQDFLGWRSDICICSSLMKRTWRFAVLERVLRKRLRRINILQ